ncbi:MAG: DegT/DnrJ/EryC1/StrS aminotransferase family protein [Rhodobacteraceae bacterium]|nr:DegT/DnrJ/EryC1/StrS aminotransferase family protein [Paracoccaceae bacterium]
MRIFRGSFTQQEPMPEEAVAAAASVLRSGRLHRYNLTAGESSEAALLETEFAAWQGRKFCLALTSGGQAMQIALRAAGVRPGHQVLTNAFTLAPVPGAIHATGAQAILVETDANLRIDLEDLKAKAENSTAGILLLTKMRGHVPDMTKTMSVAEAAGLTVIEDCAHTMGAKWCGKRSGNFGLAGCFSTQTYKHLNSGEGGLLVSDDAEFMARATILSGSYMFFDRHGAAPGGGDFAAARYEMANMSARMDNLRAAILRPQLPQLEANIGRWNDRYAALAASLATSPHITLPVRGMGESMVGSSLQFRLPDAGAAASRRIIDRAAANGVEIKWFGDPVPRGFTSTHHSWRYLGGSDLPRTDAILAHLFDIRLPLTFSIADCRMIGKILCDVIAAEMGKAGNADLSDSQDSGDGNPVPA